GLRLARDLAALHRGGPADPQAQVDAGAVAALGGFGGCGRHSSSLSVSQATSESAPLKASPVGAPSAHPRRLTLLVGGGASLPLQIHRQRRGGPSGHHTLTAGAGAEGRLAD